MKTICFAFLALGILFSCCNAKKHESVPPKPLPDFENNCVLELQLDSTTSCRIVKPAYVVLNGEHYLVIRNKPKTLLSYDFVSGK
jgi:hypothetical protein